MSKAPFVRLSQSAAFHPEMLLPMFITKSTSRKCISLTKLAMKLNHHCTFVTTSLFGDSTTFFL